MAIDCFSKKYGNKGRAFNLPMELNDCIYVILRINRARCTLNKKILNLLNEESVFGESSGRASL